MKKFIYFTLLSLFFLLACTSRKNEKKSGAMAGFSSYYNTIFNSQQALETELENRKQNHKDNYNLPYIPLLKHDEQLLGADLEASAMFSSVSPTANRSGGNSNISTLQIAEAKALKAISKYSVMKNGEERNKKMFDAHLLLAQARLYMNKPLEALDALNFIFANMGKDKRLDLAKVYQAHAFTKMRDYTRANEVFSELDQKNLKKSHQKLKTIYYSEMLLNAGKKEEAVAELGEAFLVNKNRVMRSRIAFLRGQILSQLNKPEEARESFTTAYKYSNDFEFEVKSQLEIAKTFSGKNDDYEGAKKYIEDISKKGTYASRKNEFYYALGLMAKKAGKLDEAQAYFDKAKAEKISDPQVRGLTFYEIGKFHFDRNDYISAGAYYDSALTVMNYEPTINELKRTSTNIKDVAKNYYLIKKNDSILALTKMPEDQRIAYFSKYIENLKANEAKVEAEQKKAERNKGFDNADYNANSIFSKSGSTNTFQDFTVGTSKSTFYFANQNTVSKGQNEFKQIWGGRSLVDNWRFSNRTTSLEDAKNEALGITSAPNPRRFEPSYYIEKIPENPIAISTLKKDRDTATLGLGRMYDEYFSNRLLATKTLYDLVDNQPEDEVKLQALYRIFSMNYESHPSEAERAKQLILTEFPYTSYAEFVKNPKNREFSKSVPEVENMYKQAYDLYKEEKFEDSKSVISKAIEQYPKDALVPKFSLLNAMNTGKTAGKEVMILQLQQIALNYAKTDEGLKAQQMLSYLKTDLGDLKTTDVPQPVINQRPISNTQQGNDATNTNDNAKEPIQQSTPPKSGESKKPKPPTINDWQ